MADTYARPQYRIQFKIEDEEGGLLELSVADKVRLQMNRVVLILTSPAVSATS